MVDKEVVDEIVFEMGKISESLGFPPVIFKTWAELYFKGDMTQDQLKEQLKCSLSSISQAINILEKLGTIYVSRKDGRKNIYTAETSFNKIKRKKIEAFIMFQIEPMTNLLGSRMEQINNKETKNKIKELKNMYSRTGTMMKLILKMPFGK